MYNCNNINVNILAVGHDYLLRHSDIFAFYLGVRYYTN